jgi:hypothetical protein
LGGKKDLRTKLGGREATLKRGYKQLQSKNFGKPRATSFLQEPTIYFPSFFFPPTLSFIINN